MKMNILITMAGSGYRFKQESFFDKFRPNRI